MSTNTDNSSKMMADAICAKYPDVMDANSFLKLTETETECADTFGFYKINKYYYSKKAFYKFDIDFLWHEIEVDTLIYDISSWVKDIYEYQALPALNEKMQKIDSQITYIKKKKGIESAEYKNLDEEKQKLAKFMGDVKKRYLAINKHSYLGNVVKFLKTYIANDSFAEQLNRKNPHLLPIKNYQVIDLTNGKTRTRTSGDYFSYECPVQLTKTRSDFFQSFISSVMCEKEDHIEYLQKILGYALTGETKSRCFFVWWGKGRNGKSVLLKLMEAILKEQAQTISKEIIINNGKKTAGGPELLSIKDARLLTFSETDAKEALNEGLIKMMTGADTIKARGLYKDPIVFTPIGKLVIATNNKPEFDGNSQANIDRIKFVPFLARFVEEEEENKKKHKYKIILEIHKTLIENHLDEFFSWCVEGAIQFYKNPTFNPPVEIAEHQSSYIQSQATFASWISERIEVNEKGTIARSSLYDDYSQFCQDLDLMKLNKRAFLELVENEFGKAQKTKGIYCIKGYQFKFNESDNEDDENKITV